MSLSKTSGVMAAMQNSAISLKETTYSLAAHAAKMDTTTVQAGLSSIIDTLRPIKPFVLSRLIRNIIDAESIEHFTFSLIAIIDLYSDYLPSFDSISKEAIGELWEFFKFWRMKSESEPEELEPQAFVRQEEPSPQLRSLAAKFGLDTDKICKEFTSLELPLALLSGLLGLAAMFFGDKLVAFFIDPRVFTSSLAKTAKLIKDSKVVWSTFDETWEHIMKWIGSFFGYQFIPDRDVKSTEIMNRIASIRDEFSKLKETCLTDLTSIVQSELGLTELEDTVSKLEKEIDNLVKQQQTKVNFTPYIQQFNNTIKDIRLTVCEAKNSAAGKQHPVVIQLWGAPGLGKSELAKLIVKKLSEFEGRKLSIYYRNSASDKFWSGYTHQDVVVYDEWCQDKENIDHKELFGIFTCAQYKLNMADVSQKGRVFTSRYVILCSNEAYVSTSTTIRDIAALNRRRHFLYEVLSPEVQAYLDTHSELPPPNSTIWKADCSHLNISSNLVLEQRGNPRWDDIRVTGVNISPNKIAQDMYDMQVYMKQRYEAELKEAQAAGDEFKTRRNNFAIFNELDIEIDPERPERPYRLPTAIVRPPVYVEEVIPDQIEELQEQSIVEDITGSNLFLLQGPSGCGKSYLLENMSYTKVWTLDDIYQGGTLKIPNANYHVEDISITPERTNHAIDICQRLSDDPKFTGSCVFSANTDMLKQNLKSRGEEALEVFYRRCKVITIKTKMQCFFTRKNARDIGPGTTWDDIYNATYEDVTHNVTSKVNFLEAQLKLQTTDKTVTARAVFDNQTLEDFEESKAILLEIPDISWEAFQQMENYTVLGDYLTHGSILRAALHLRHYLNVFKSLPTSYASPAQLVNTINRSNLQVAATTPSAIIKFEDFRILLINHRTYVQLQIQTQIYNIPDVGQLPTIPLIQNEEKTSIWKLITQFSSLVVGGVLISRELFGLNKKKSNTPKLMKPKKQKPSKRQVKFLIFAPPNWGKTTWQERSALGQFFVDTDDQGCDDFTLSNESYTLDLAQEGIVFLPTEREFQNRHHAPITSFADPHEHYQEILDAIERNPHLLVIHLKKTEYLTSHTLTIEKHFMKKYPMYRDDLTKIKDERRQLGQESKKHRAVARSQRPVQVKQPDPSSGKAISAKKQATYENESKINRMYDPGHIKVKVNPETKILTHTDLQQRYSLPEYKNVVEVEQYSKYHPLNFPKLLEQLIENDPTQSHKNFTIYCQKFEIDPEFYRQECIFVGLPPEKVLFWTEFLNMYLENNLQPESLSDPQAAQLIPLITANQVYVMEGDIISQRALMVHGHVGVTTAHGVSEHSYIKIPSTGATHKMTIRSQNIDKDICIFEVDKKCQQFRDIRAFIRSYSDTEILDGCDAFFLTVHNINKNLIAQIRATKVMTRKEVKYGNRVRNGYYYGGTLTGFDLPFPSLTEKGHCGSPGVILNTRYTRKIISIHSAGSDTNAFGLPIYKEMFESKFEPQSNTLDDIKVLPHQELSTIYPFKIGEFTARYELKFNNSAPVKTCIYRSPLQSDMFGDNFEPSILATYDSRNIDNVLIDHVTIDKWAREQPKDLDLELLDEVVEEWAEWFHNLIKREDLQQYTLTKTEAINRTTYYTSSQPIPRDTSAGYPWKHRPGAVGKKLFIQPRQHKTAILNCIPKDENGQDLLNAINSLIETCKHGERPAVVFSSSAKDEVLKKKKIYPCRTRGFAGAPIDYSIAHRMFFHTAVCALIETRRQSPIKVGIEANGDEWNELWNWLADNSTVGFDADFKDWDATIPRAIMERLHRIYNRIYEATPRDRSTLNDDNQIRKYLHSVLWGPLLTLGQYVVQAPGGQVSGQPATTIDNCMVGLIIMYYAWKKLAPAKLSNFQSFLDNVRIAVYGDDQIVTVKPECLGFFNLETVKEIIGHDIGMEITSAAKDGKILTFKHLEEMEFLKRNFVSVGPYKYGKLQDIVFDKMLNWTHTYRHHHYFKEPNKIHFEPLTIEASIESMLYELCLFPPEKYNAVVEHCNTVLNNIGSKKKLPSQRAMLEQRGVPHRLFLSTFRQTQS